MNITDKPLAVKGLTSYRYKGRYSYIMIGAESDIDALKEAERSFADNSIAVICKLEIYNNGKYQKVNP